MVNYKQLSLTKLAMFLLALLLFASCTKDKISEPYPDSLTISNWEQFVDAPQEVIDRLQAEERAKFATGTQSDTLKLPGSRLFEFGWVRAWDGNWKNIPGVSVETNDCNATTVGFTLTGNNYYLSSTCADYRCLSYETPVTNGVSSLDLVLIDRHIQGISTFCSYREMVAADADADGDLDATDLSIIEGVILGSLRSFPSDNVKFPSLSLYEYFDDGWDCGDGVYEPFTYGNCDTEQDYYAIKTGDVNGTFSF